MADLAEEISAVVTPRPGLHSLVLPQGAIRRELIEPELPRAPEFLARYEHYCIFYDVYWDATGTRIIMQGPPPINLARFYREATYIAQPSGIALTAKAHHSEKVYLYSLEAPAGTTSLDITFAGSQFSVSVGRNYSSFFENEDLLCTVSKNNDLQWIVDWARFHVVNQGATAVLLFDNGSDRYTLSNLEAALTSVVGLRKVCVVPVPFAYQRPDDALPKKRFWAHFLQPSLFVNMFRRYGAHAGGILNCDIDELLVPLKGQTVFEAARASRSGTVYFRSRWIEPVPGELRPNGYRHRDFYLTRPQTDATRGKTDKWAMAPDRKWLQDLRVHPYTHLIQNRPPFTRHKPNNAYIAHFRGISTGWKYDRPITLERSESLVEDGELMRAMDKAFGEANRGG